MTRIVEYFELPLVLTLLTSVVLFVAADTVGDPMAPAQSGRGRESVFVFVCGFGFVEISIGSR